MIVEEYVGKEDEDKIISSYVYVLLPTFERWIV